MATSIWHLLPKPAVLVPHTTVCHRHSFETIRSENNFLKQSCCQGQHMTPTQIWQLHKTKAGLAIHCISFSALPDFCYVLSYTHLLPPPSTPQFCTCWHFLCFSYCRGISLNTSATYIIKIVKWMEVLKSFLIFGIWS